MIFKKLLVGSAIIGIILIITICFHSINFDKTIAQIDGKVFLRNEEEIEKQISKLYEEIVKEYDEALKESNLFNQIKNPNDIEWDTFIRKAISSQKRIIELEKDIVILKGKLDRSFNNKEEIIELEKKLERLKYIEKLPNINNRINDKVIFPH